ncbi:MAG: outer membrane beta-barrel protein [Bacteroidales bacterium]|nr:outer membrane beta-barrel protein [Bacteroidales bacterium]
MKKTLIILLCLLCGWTCRAQKSEIGAMVGTSFYLGDLNPRTVFGMPQLAGGIIYRYNFSPRWAIRANVLFAKVAGDDAITNKHYERNLSFTSPITEIAVQGELNFFRLYHERGKNFFSPYLFGGIALFSFNPQAADVDGTVYDLQPLGTEGQGFEGERKHYSLCNVAIPFGLGFRFNFAKYISLGFEWGMRFTFTDYLDDVSGNYYDNQLLKENRGSAVARLADKSENVHAAGTGRGNSTTKDFYSFAGVVLTVRFGEADNHCNLRTNVHRKAVGGTSK